MLHGLDLFSGYGGITLGLSQWVRPVAYCEIDAFAQAILLSRMEDGHLPEAPIFGDITKLSKQSLFDMLSFYQEEKSMKGRLRKLTEEQAKEAVELYNNGSSIGEIAHLYSVTRQAMWDLLRRRTSMRSAQKFGSENHFYRGGARADARAHDITEKAILSGRLVNPGSCEICSWSGIYKDGRTAIQAHHDDYNEPLKVRWLCKRCHHEWHKHNQPIPLRKGGEKESQTVDIIYGGFP